MNGWMCARLLYVGKAKLMANFYHYLIYVVDAIWLWCLRFSLQSSYYIVIVTTKISRLKLAKWISADHQKGREVADSLSPLFISHETLSITRVHSWFRYLTSLIFIHSKKCAPHNSTFNRAHMNDINCIVCVWVFVVRGSAYNFRGFFIVPQYWNIVMGFIHGPGMADRKAFIILSSSWKV